MKYFLATVSISLSFLLAPVAVMAASSDVSASESSVITVGGINLTISDTANFDSITVNGSDFTMDLSKGASLTVTSSDRRKFTVSPSTYQQSFSCGSSNSTLQVGNNLWDSTVTITVTPSSDTCVVEGGGGGGGSSGGGGNNVTPTYVVIPGTVVKSTKTTKTTQETPSVVSVPISVSGKKISFTRALKVKMIGSDVKLLQQVLNSDSDTRVAKSGAGSPGSETNYFGTQTGNAVKKFQEKYKIAKKGVPGYGLVGPKTRAKLEELAGVKKESTEPVSSSTTSQIDALQAQIQTLMKQIETLQAQIKTAKQ
ncbi:MAG: peptidoglycan-binding protein [bacterium]|nr:peptidoglycan-binding protein [bacterium]